MPRALDLALTGGNNNHWVGQQNATTGQRHGAQARFENYSLLTCIQPDPDFLEVSGSFVLSNIIPTDGQFNDILQIGAGKCVSPSCPSGMRYYSGFGLTHTTPGCAGWQDQPPLLLFEGNWTAASHSLLTAKTSQTWAGSDEPGKGGAGRWRHVAEGRFPLASVPQQRTCRFALKRTIGHTGARQSARQ